MDRIDDFPMLCASLGKARTDRIRSHQCPVHEIGGPRTRWVTNTFHDLLASFERAEHAGSSIEDIFTGVARSDGAGDKSLSSGRLFVLLACNRRLSTDLIQSTMKLDARQARRYMAAARLVLYFMARKLVSTELLRRSPTLAELRTTR